MGIHLDVPLKEAPGIPSGFQKKLEKLGLHTIRDLLWHFPIRYEDFSDTYQIADIVPGQLVTIQGVVESADVRRVWRRRMTIVEALIRDESGTIKAIWFNQPYIAQTLKPGRPYNFSGKAGITNSELYLRHPAYEFVNSRRNETTHTARLVPIYPETRGLTSRGIRYLIQPLLSYVDMPPEWIPAEVLIRENLPNLSEALRMIHFPETIEESETARRRFTFENLFLLQLLNLHHKKKLAEHKAPAIAIDLAELKRLTAALPFELTFSQKRSLWEVLKDMEKPVPMNRLLQGDVGSGKTVVAALAAIIAAGQGYQTALMAPTEILTEQHFGTFLKLLPRLELREKPVTGIITSSGARVFYDENLSRAVKKTEFWEKVRAGEVHIIIGTHSLISQPQGRASRFSKLGLVVIDEQHRFGVRQRAGLSKSASKRMGPIPHFLSMSATPIPRTLMLTVFGDLDISQITEMPKGRMEIITRVVPPQERQKAYEFIRAQVKTGRQVFVICPRIEAETSADKASVLKLETKSAVQEYEKLSKEIFPEFKVALLHGQLPAKKKQDTMAAFREGTINILVSTSVVEVGVDIPNATIMMIEGSDRFGLAQLYQFRGRVGRGEHQSYCFLFMDSDSATAKARLKAILQAKNGLELAEYDLKLRGPGEFLGEAQTGFPDFAMQALQNMELVKSSREAAAEVLRTDRELVKHPELKSRFGAFARTLHQE